MSHCQNNELNISNFNDLEEGEISESYINKQEILNLIDKKKTRDCKKIIDIFVETSMIDQTKTSNIKLNDSSLKVEESDSEESEEEGYFHKMLKKDEIRINKQQEENNIKENENSLQKKRKRKERSHEIKKNKVEVVKIKKEKSNNKPKQICQFFINGACNKGTECTYSHSALQQKKTDICKYFLTDSCLKGDECLFSHDKSLFPCKFFHAIGYCNLGDDCQFSHRRLSEMEIYKFIEQNEDFIMALYKSTGKTNMDEFLSEYISEKKKMSFREYIDKLKPSPDAMLPANLIEQIHKKQLNILQNFHQNSSQNLLQPNISQIKQPIIETQPRPCFNPNMIHPRMFQMFMKNPIMTQMFRNPTIQQNTGLNQSNIQLNMQCNLANNMFNFHKFNEMNKSRKFSNDTVDKNPVISPIININQPDEIIFNDKKQEKIQLNNESFLNIINPFEKPIIKNINFLQEKEKLKYNSESKQIQQIDYTFQEEEKDFFSNTCELIENNNEKMKKPKDPRKRNKKHD